MTTWTIWSEVISLARMKSAEGHNQWLEHLPADHWWVWTFTTSKSFLETFFSISSPSQISDCPEIHFLCRQTLSHSFPLKSLQLFTLRQKSISNFVRVFFFFWWVDARICCKGNLTSFPFFRATREACCSSLVLSASSRLIAPLSHNALFLQLSHVRLKTPSCGFCRGRVMRVPCVYGPRISAAPALSPLIARRLGRQGNELYSVAPLFSLMTFWKVALRGARRRGFLFFFSAKGLKGYIETRCDAQCVGSTRRLAPLEIQCLIQGQSCLWWDLHVWSGSRRTPCWAGISATPLQGNEGPQRTAVSNLNGTLSVL